MVPLNWYLILSFCLFGIGLTGFLIRKNLIMLLISIEVMLNAVNLSLVALGHYLQDLKAQVIALFIIGCAAGAVAVGLIILVIAYRNKPTLKIEEFNLLRED
ncbi:NADH-quinone oxidoreductase subunit NuoK [Thermodesulfobacterium sp. TA1]|uniref:NADH-quinone oxidoreductase subunit NuoK n=1 Tax=Thermodesulfobacterium sp. TA1 TaxID=2234087 RepID=UPI0012320EBA|nr:NADH-quinone oxidoreductase subunit NuoK [Thermodesulfobacterium sp. TA1]QER42646.1 NADH-quinone oxidoreductase subunit NuoK [Thermodesulfobacterium sp. TA1]